VSAPAEISHRLLKRLGRLKLIFQFAFARANSPREAARLFYYAGLKASLVHRGWVNYSPERILRFSTRISPGTTFQVHARDNATDPETFAEFFSSQYEIIPPELPPMEPRVIYDLGANVGIASLYFAARYPQAAFYGFEPVPMNFEVCSLNYRNLANAHAFPWAVGAHSGVASFEMSAADLRGGRLTGCPPPPEGVLDRRIEVQVFTVPDLLKRQQLPAPDFLKVDVEGAEADVLMGLGDQCPSIKRMLVETHGPKLELACLQWLREHCFVVRHAHSAAPGFSSIWADRI
jgi:FkbM family methyltransferase